eukprot:3967315-Pyramimonas_sp.AAC.1
MLPYTPSTRPKHPPTAVALLPSKSARSQSGHFGQYRMPKMHSSTRPTMTRNPSTPASGPRASTALL